MLSTAARSVVCAAALSAVLVPACKGKDTGTPDPGDTDFVEAEFGYDTRPSNPTCLAPPERLVEDAEIDFERVFASVQLTDPVGMFQAPGDDTHWYVIEQAGRVKRFDATVAEPTADIVLDITGPVASGGERGLLGMAFHPDFANNGLAYVSYTSNGPVSHIASVQTSDNGATWDVGSLDNLISVDQPYGNHNGGHIAFGPDGMLYWTLGDGGSAGDPQNYAQNLSSLLGKILRIDVDNPANGQGYGVPDDNPFVDTPGAAPEIYAFGLRNVWRFSFDSVTGEMWAGDVGQNAIEEVNLIEAGGNYGWRLKEGRECYATSPCEGGGLIDPVVQYQQNPGLSVMGGVVYRGSAIPALVGTYLFSDYYHGRIIGVTYDAATGEPRRDRLVDTNRAIVHFAEANDGEVYFIDHQAGRLFQIVPVDGGQTPDFPMRLSETGCVDENDPRVVRSGVIPYELNHPFWSDGAEKRRWLALPDGTAMTLGNDGDLEFPVGTVLIKEFAVNDIVVETRLFMRHTDEWAGYSYAWREDGSDADLVASATVDAGDTTWQIPSRATCMQCHTEAAGRSLGVEVGQLIDLSVAYPETNRIAPQLDTLVHIGLIEGMPPELPAFPAVDDTTADLDARARAYLHVNCSQCHRPGGSGRGELDLRYATPLSETNLCDAPEHGTLGNPGAMIVTPGDPAASMLSVRMRDPGAYRMPPIATHVVDEVGATVLDDWITTLTSCD
jgi:uncharacterized repeat protein (TIGR03806 family)